MKHQPEWTPTLWKIALLGALSASSCAMQGGASNATNVSGSHQTTQDLIATAIRGMPPQFPIGDVIVLEDADKTKWRRFLYVFHGWETVRRSRLLSDIVSGGGYAVFAVEYKLKVLGDGSYIATDDGSSLIVMDKSDTSRVMWIKNQLLDDATKAILYP